MTCAWENEDVSGRVPKTMMANSVLLLAVGLTAGIASGLFGIGGGLIIVPGLIYLLGMSQMEATGTSLAALIPPVGLLGALEYYRSGFINVRYAALIAAGLFVGANFGAKLVVSLPPVLLRRAYAVFMIGVASKMLFSK